MKRLVSLAAVVAFFVAIPQCLGQSQDAEQSPAQLPEEQQLVEMALLLTAPPTIASVPVSNLLLAPPAKITICHFKRIRKHCEGEGGGRRTIRHTQKSTDQHNAHGDCSGSDVVDSWPLHMRPAPAGNRGQHPTTIVVVSGIYSHSS